MPSPSLQQTLESLIAGWEGECVEFKAANDNYLILEYLRKFGQGRRANFERLLAGKLSDVLNDRQKTAKIHNLLQKMKRQGKLASEGRTSGVVWKLVSPEPMAKPNSDSV